jgi:hypothetical protein
VQVAERGQRGRDGVGRGGDAADLAGGEGVAFGGIEVPRAGCQMASTS